MNIRHQCPLPELSFPVTAPLHLTKENGCKLISHRWSLAGLWTDPAHGDLSGEVMLSVPFQGVDVSFPAQLQATQTPGQFSFHQLTVRQRETLGAFHQGVLSGQMVTTRDMITSLDTPVDLVPMGETQGEQTAADMVAPQRPLRAVWNTAFYLLAAAFLLLFLGGQIWQRLTHIQLDHARFTAPVTAYTAPEAGYVTRIGVAVGDPVKRGDVLARIEDPDRESDVEDVRAEVLLAQRRLATAQERLGRHTAAQRARLGAAQARFDVLWAPWQRNDPHLLPYPAGVEEARRARLALARNSDPQTADLLATLQEAVGARDLDLRRWKRELRHRKAAADQLVVRARNNGTVFALHTLKGAHVGRGDPVIEVEDNTPRHAVGWADDRMATRIHIGMPAQIAYVFRGQSKHIAGRVSDIQAGADAAQPDKYGMLITIKADDAGLRNSRKWFRRGAPARIRLERRLFSGWFGGRDEGA